MADNLLNLVVKFSALDGLSGSLKSMIGLGRSSKDQMRALTGELANVKKGIKGYDDELKKATGNVTRLYDAQQKLIRQEGELRAQIERRKRIDAIDGRTARVQRRADAYVSEGKAGLFSAAMMLAPGAAIAHEAGDYQALQNKLRILGLNNGAVDELTAYSKAMGIAGSSARENLRYIVEAQGAFRESGEHSAEEQLRGAKMMAPMMAKMAATLKASGKELGEEQERYFLRFVEQAGGTVDPRRAKELTDGLFRAIQSSGGTVDPAAYQGFLARAGTSGMRLSARTMFADFEPLIAELHDSAGVGLQTAYSRMNGMVKNQAAARELLRLGLWNKDSVIFNQMGGIKDFKNGANPMGKDAAAMLSSDPVEFYRKFVLAAYQKRGVTDIERENMLLFGKTGGALFNLINKQMPTILRSREAFNKTQGLDDAYNTTKDSFFGQQGQMTAAAKDFMVVAGSKGGLLDSMTGLLRSATGALRGLTNAANAHPTAFKWIGTAVMWLIGLRVAMSVGKIAIGGLLGPVGQLWGAWSKYRALGSIAAAFPRFAAVLRFVGMAARFVLPWIAAIPVSWMLIGVAVGLAAALVWRNWGRIKAAFWGGVATIKAAMGALPAWLKGLGGMMMQGLLMDLNPALLVNRLTAIAKAGATAFKNYFGIKSPSRLMMAMGGHIASGLGVGMDQHAHRPKAAMKRIAAAVAGAGALSLAPAASARAPSAAPRAGGNIEIHIHQLPGEDAGDLARRVMELIERAKRGSGLSSFQDDF